MRLEDLRTFCDVAHCHSFSEAASLNGVTQSAVSQAIHRLERNLGVQLLDRSTRPPRLTVLGRRFHEGCRRLVEEYGALEAAVRKEWAHTATTVRVAAIYSVGLRDMNQYIQRFAVRWPGGSVHIEYLHPRRVYERVLDGAVDLGLVSYPRESRRLVALPWKEEEMVLACPRGHPLARRRKVGLTELQNVSYIAFDRDLEIRRRIDRFLHEHGISVNVALEFDNIESVKKAIEESGGVALLPEPMLQREVHSGVLVSVPLDGCRLIRPLAIVYRRGHHLTQAVAAFVELLRQCDAVESSESAVTLTPDARVTGAAKPRPSPTKVRGDRAPRKG